jgi:hypothetical protein
MRDKMNKKLMFWIAAILYCSAAFFWMTGRFRLAIAEVFVISVVFWCLAPFFQKGTQNLTFLEKIQRHLKLDFVNVKVKKAKPKRIIAGFMIPLFPFFARIRYPTKEKIAEAIVHELSHIWWFIYGFQLACLMALIYVLELLHTSVWLKVSFIMVYLLIQEHLAFSSTVKLDKKMSLGIKPQKMSLKTIFKYVLVYGTVLYSFLLIFLVIGAKWWFGFDILLFAGIVVLIDRGFWYVFKAIDKIWKTKAL